MSEHCCCGGGHHEGHEEACSCGCQSKAHIHEHEAEKSCHCAEAFLHIADAAWKEVLKERIKDKIIAQKGEHIEKLAELIATANGEKWKYIMTAKAKCNKFKDNLKEFLSSCE